MKYKSQPCLLRASPRLTSCTMSPHHSPDECSIQQLAQSALKSEAVKAEPFNGRVFRTFRLQASAVDCFYVLKCRPSTQVGLLRHEEARLEIEASTLQALQSQTAASLPKLVAYNDARTSIGSAYLISGPFKGSVLSDVEHTMSQAALACTDRSIGRYVLELASISGPRFGPLHPAALGSSSWATYFLCLTQTVLQDGEDALVNLPYDVVRYQIHRHHASLDRVTSPRMVVLETASAGNVLVDTKDWQVSGLLDFSTAIWGDPCLSDCFYKPSAAFIEGFGRLPNRDVHEQIRQYLYIIYHAVLAIVRCSYRPSEDNDELEARRNLTTALAQLSNVTI